MLQLELPCARFALLIFSFTGAWWTLFCHLPFQFCFFGLFSYWSTELFWFHRCSVSSSESSTECWSAAPETSCWRGDWCSCAERVIPSYAPPDSWTAAAATTEAAIRGPEGSTAAAATGIRAVQGSAEAVEPLGRFRRRHSWMSNSDCRFMMGYHMFPDIYFLRF